MNPRRTSGESDGRGYDAVRHGARPEVRRRATATPRSQLPRAGQRLLRKTEEENRRLRCWVPVPARVSWVLATGPGGLAHSPVSCRARDRPVGTETSAREPYCTERCGPLSLSGDGTWKTESRRACQRRIVRLAGEYRHVKTKGARIATVYGRTELEHVACTVAEPARHARIGRSRLTTSDNDRRRRTVKQAACTGR